MVEETQIESVSADDGSFEYQPVERWAVISLVLALFSPLALLAPVMWCVPILAGLVGTVALIKIRGEPGRPGRSLALASIGLATLFFVMPVARIFSTLLILRGQPRPVAEQFFEYLKQGQPEKAITLKWAPDYRQGLSDDLWLFIRSNEEASGEFEAFIRHPIVRMLLALGEKADVSYYETEVVGASGDLAQVRSTYAVTFDDEDGKKKTYFISLLMERKPTRNPRLNPWRVREYQGGFIPS